MASPMRLMKFAPRVRFVSRTRQFSTRPAALEKRYTSSHEWVDLNGKIATIGITNYAAKALGDVVYVELPEADLDLEQGAEMGAVESVKSASDIYSPVSGKVVETNSVLEEKPGTINKSPEGEGWLAKVEISNPEQLEKLLSKEDYDALEKGEH